MFLTAIITASDKGYAGERTDESGPAIAAMLDENYRVVSRTVLPDDRKMLADECGGCAGSPWTSSSRQGAPDFQSGM